MATTPYFILSPNTILSIVGLLHGPDKTVPTPPEDWRQAKVDVVMTKAATEFITPAKNAHAQRNAYVQKSAGIQR